LYLSKIWKYDWGTLPFRLCKQQAAAGHRSDGDGSTLQVHIRQLNEGVNAADGNAYIVELRRQIA